MDRRFPLLPGNGFASSEFKPRTHSTVRPFQSAVNAIVRPSGEMAKPSNEVFSGGRIESRNSKGCPGGVLPKYSHISATAARQNSAQPACDMTQEGRPEAIAGSCRSENSGT